MLFNENTLVKIPALVHFTRLGYDFVPLRPHSEGIVYDGETNIFIDIFQKSISRINNIELSRDEAISLIKSLSNKLSDNTLGRPFYKILVDGIDGIRLIDSANPDNNSFNLVTELTYKNGEDEFRPDIVPLLNGIPLSFSLKKIVISVFRIRLPPPQKSITVVIKSRTRYRRCDPGLGPAFLRPSMSKKP
jgi:type I restriction enzyme R subunit